MHYIGSHVSASGGVHLAIERAVEIGANAVALFTKNQKQWKAPPLTQENIDLFKEAMKKASFSPFQVLPHDSYLINLGNPDDQKRRISTDAFTNELQRVKALGLDRLNFHPGAHLKQIDEKGSMDLIASAIDEALHEVEGVYAVIETTAGQGSALGRSFEEIAYIIDKSTMKDRIGVCIDTCHIFAAGYDIRDEESFYTMIEKYEALIGFDKLMGMHLNDAKSEYNSKVDRHAPLGDGNIGMYPFIEIMKDKRFANIPLILETPIPERWSEEISLLRSYAT